MPELWELLLAACMFLGAALYTGASAYGNLAIVKALPPNLPLYAGAVFKGTDKAPQLACIDPATNSSLA